VEKVNAKKIDMIPSPIVDKRYERVDWGLFLKRWGNDGNEKGNAIQPVRFTC
jgi:hypothetical protein